MVGPAIGDGVGRPFPMTLAAVLQHLKVLQDSGLVSTEKHGRVRTCRVEPEPTARGGTLDRRATHDVGTPARPPDQHLLERADARRPGQRIRHATTSPTHPKGPNHDRECREPCPTRVSPSSGSSTPHPAKVFAAFADPEHEGEVVRRTRTVAPDQCRDGLSRGRHASTTRASSARAARYPGSTPTTSRSSRHPDRLQLRDAGQRRTACRSRWPRSSSPRRARART